MRLLSAGARGIPVVLAVLAALAIGALHVPAADPEKKEEKKDETPEKRYAFAMDGKPWDAVFKWLVDETGKPLSTTAKPTGSFSFIGPAKKTYSLPEIIDLINDGLVTNSPTQKYYLINGDHSFYVVAADEKVDPVILPQLEGPEELVKHGETELVRMDLPLTSLNAEDLAPRLGAIMGPFHESVSMPGNRLILQDTVRNLKRVVKTIKDIQDSEKTNTDSYSHECKYIRARDAEKYLRTLLGEPQPVQAPPQSSRDRDNPPQPTPQPMSPMGQPMGQMGQPPFPPMGPMGQPPFQPMGQPFQPMGQPTYPQVPSRPTHIRMFYITSDDAKNLILVTGPPEIIAKAKDIVENRLDKPAPGQQPVLVGPPSFKNIAVPDGNADGLARDLQAPFPPSSTLRISAAGTNALRVYACPEDMDQIERMVALLSKGVKGVLVPVGGLDAAKAATTLLAMFGDPKSGGPYIEAVPDNNGVLVRGTPEQVEQIRQIVKVMNGEGGAPNEVGPSFDASTTRVITLDNGSGAAVADELQRILKQMRSNPIRVITPGGGADKGEDKIPLLPPPPPIMPKAPDARKNTAGDTILVAQKPGDGAPLVDPQEKKEPKPEDKPGKADMPVYITASGNRIIITSQDPAALAMAQQLVRLMTQTTAGEGDFEVIHLKTASAVEAAKLLDQAFNGPSQTAPQPQQGNPFGRGASFFQQFGAPQAQAPTNPTPNRIRIVADPTTNSLLVRAKPVDMLTVRWLLAKAIDTNEKNADGPKTRVIGPLKFARATDVSTLIKTVFADQVSQNPTLQDIQRPGSFGLAIAGAQNRNLDINGQPRPVALTVAVDDTSNSLLVNCTQALYEDVKQLVDQLELAAQNNTHTVKVVRTEGVDPAVIEQAIEAITGRGTGASGGSSTPGGFQPGGFQPGGFQPGGQPGGFPGGFQQGNQGPGRRGRGQRAPDREGRGPDFFDGRVMDDPTPALFFDPQHAAAPQRTKTDAAVQPARYEELQPAPLPGPAGADTIVAPRSPVNIQSLPSLGAVIISAQNPADAKAIEDLIALIIEKSKNTQLKIRLVLLEKADATSVANTLSQLYQRVNVSPTGNALNATTTQTQQTQQGIITTQPLSSVVLIPVPRLNALLLAVPGTRMDEVLADIKKLDVDTSPAGQTTPFHLKKASASRVGPLLTNFYNQRYAAGQGQEGAAQHQVRITFDTSSNTLFVQAAPADMTEIRNLIEHLDADVPAAISNLRIKHLKHAVADNVANLLQRAIGNGVTPFVQPPAATGTGANQSAAPGGNQGGTPGGFPGGNQGGTPGGFLGGNQGGTPGGFPGGNQGGAPGGFPGANTGAQRATTGATTSSLTGAQGAITKSQTLQFIDPRTGKIVESGLLEDIFILPDENTNSLLISAPDKSMELLDALIDALDVPPAAQYVVKVITLKKSDAASVAAMLQQLFLGTSSTGAGARTTPGAPGATGAPGVSSAGQLFQLTLNGLSEGLQLTDLRITVDERTNSIIVAGGPSDLDIIQAVIAKLEASPEANDLAMRRNEVYHLKNSTAVDVANAVNAFLTNSITILKTNGLTPFQDVQREVIVVPEPITNKLLISATPTMYPEVLRVIEELDAESPQVVIQVLIAEVDLTGNEEFGVEFGLQSPVLFQRGIFPAAGLLGTNGSVSFANATGGVITPGVTVNSTINPTAQPGFNFNNPSVALGNNPAVSPNVIGTQGLSSLGVGRVSPTSGVGGFVFSAQSDVFNVLVRALKSQGRIDILSRPQVMTLDNQSASVLVGQSIPYVSSTNVTATGLVTNGITYRDVGVQMQVTPKISPDGRVVMRVTPEVSSVAPTSISIGNGVTATAFNVQNVTTTVSAEDGQTVAIGGLITRRDEKDENKIPWFGDLPGVGVLFRYRTQIKEKRELLVILTPHIVKSRMEAERLLAEESRRMDWVVGDAVRLHGMSGMEPVLHPDAFAPPIHQGGVDACLPSPLASPIVPPATVSPIPPALETLPPPRPPPSGTDQPAPMPGPGAARPTSAPVQQAAAVMLPPPPGFPSGAALSSPPAAGSQVPAPSSEAKEPARKRWLPGLFPGP